MQTTVFDVFRACVTAIKQGRFISRESRQDKEFHFQNWFRDRLNETGLHHEQGGRNSYPDFRMVSFTEGYEVKGLAYPGREANYDSNSQVPAGVHNGRTIFYVFGRYPAAPDGDSYPVLDLVVCHGDFLNATHDYIHKNRSVRGFGSYGDILIRDRKMYVAPTPYGLTNGAAHNITLILPETYEVGDSSLVAVGTLERRETNTLIVGYRFDLRTNDILPETVPNPAAGTKHAFRAWRTKDLPSSPVQMRSITAILEEEPELEDN